MLMRMTLSRRVHVPPKYYNSGMQRYIKDILKSEVEGRYLHGIGSIVAVIGNMEISEGFLLPESESNESAVRYGGSASFKVRYSALVFVPMINEVIDVIVGTAHETGFHATAGPMRVFVDQSRLSGYVFDSTSTPVTWVGTGDNANRVIREGGVCRCRIIGIELPATAGKVTPFAICRVDEPGLGPAEEEEEFVF
ncbi:DNA-directed RNA polymerase III subunit RPC8 [Carpediemonas membranifera]|uniref:DNA-directed RNA polymerase III subunit RPC8 n=1 Tax=Carpediemonas membranifera TaxID=201153 RepID=A0A8J6B5N2_9EUKA|nr:DNA-directed RNA polymerase III subunit RPC8 [Carpediemonas membranifera]|eukprot:KAG9393554.1 DNA-directed RNA polymerase III subunit RPC8 [Carpediemonas membranifera]